MNYNEEMKKIIKTFDNKKTILLHSCCGPCSSSVIERIKPYFDITVLYYNPNIEPKEEYEKRKSEQIRLLKELNIKYMDCDYDNDIYHEKIKGTEEEKEGGSRCTLCFMLRLTKTAKLAKENNFDYFGTTLTVSPHKNSELINKIGFKEAEKEGINFLPADLKKEEGRGEESAARKPSLEEREYYLYMPGKILHIDADLDYLNRCLKYYKEASIWATGKCINENEIKFKIKGAYNGNY